MAPACLRYILVQYPWQAYGQAGSQVYMQGYKNGCRMIAICSGDNYNAISIDFMVKDENSDSLYELDM